MTMCVSGTDARPRCIFTHTALSVRCHALLQFFFAFMQSWQKDEMLRIRPTTLHLDATHSTNRYRCALSSDM